MLASIDLWPQRGLSPRSRFSGVQFRTHPNNIGHVFFNGCFRLSWRQPQGSWRQRDQARLRDVWCDVL